MEDFDYPGIRMMLEASLDRMKQSFKIDLSTDDAITPQAMEYEYKLMFEERTISVFTYNLETLLAEKIQTILARGIANTRMRDYYDVYEVMKLKEDQIDMKMLKAAFDATCKKRENFFDERKIELVLEKIKMDDGLAELWNHFRNNYYFVEKLEWNMIVESDIACIRKLLKN